MRAALTTAAEVIGITLVSVGFWVAWPPLGLIVAGIGLIAVGVMQA